MARAAKPALAAIVAARRAREALGLREWVALPNIEPLLTDAAEMTRPAPAVPAPVDPLRVVTFTVGASVGRGGFGATSYMAGEQVGFEPSLAAKLVFEGKAVWTHPGHPQQDLLVDAARMAAEAAKPRTSGTIGITVAGSSSDYNGDSRPSSEVGPRKREDDEAA